MIREIPKEEWKVTDSYKLNFEWDGHWVVYWSPTIGPRYDGKGYVVAYGDGTPEDRDALREQVIRNRYKGRAGLLYGHKPDDVIYCGTQSEGI